jgi:hypothetical protein
MTPEHVAALILGLALILPLVPWAFLRAKKLAAARMEYMVATDLALMLESSAALVE